MYKIKDISLKFSSFYKEEKFLFFALLVKLFLFVFYAIQFHLYPEVSQESGLLYVKGGDTFTYYPPMINFLSGGDYGVSCRMPGLMPVFAPFYILTGSETFSYNAVVVVQFIVSSISVYVLGLISMLLFDNRKIYIVTVILYAIFYHIGDHYLMADSLANSILIFAVYYFLKALKEGFENKKHVFVSGLFFSWSIFLRLIAIVPFLILIIIIVYFLVVKRKQIVRAISLSLIFISCFAILESAWIIRNKLSLNRTILFTVPECYSSFSYNWIELNKIPTAWGFETTHWSGEVDWWLNKNSTSMDFPYSHVCLTKSFNVDSLVNLKNEYHALSKRGNGQSDEAINFKNKVGNYLAEFKSARPINYYIINPLRLYTKFHFHKTLADMPFPKLSEMNIFQKACKAFNWLLFLVISVVFMLAAPFSLIFNRSLKNVVFIAVPISISFFLAFLMGAIEQRYFWVIYPFAIVFFSWFLTITIRVTKNKLVNKKFLLKRKK